MEISRFCILKMKMVISTQFKHIHTKFDLHVYENACVNWNMFDPFIFVCLCVRYFAYTIYFECYRFRNDKNKKHKHLDCEEHNSLPYNIFKIYISFKYCAHIFDKKEVSTFMTMSITSWIVFTALKACHTSQQAFEVNVVKCNITDVFRI